MAKAKKGRKAVAVENQVNEEAVENQVGEESDAVEGAVEIDDAIDDAADNAQSEADGAGEKTRSQRYAEGRKRRRILGRDLARRTIEALEPTEEWKKLGKEIQDWLYDEARDGLAIPPLFEKMFGSRAKVGDKTTLFEAMSSTMRGKRELLRAVESWNKRSIETGRGVTVSFEESRENASLSTFTVQSIR